MPTMKRTILFGLCMFALGIAVGSLRFTSVGSASENPVHVDFCFLIQNPDLIGSRRFITDATIVSIFPHGSILESDSCPKRGASFSEKLDAPDFVPELRMKFHDDPYASVPVLFEGTLYRQALPVRLWYGVMNRFGLRDKTAPITVRRYKAVGGLRASNFDVFSVNPPGETLEHEPGHAVTHHER
jgi:hypothetical protein